MKTNKEEFFPYPQSLFPNPKHLCLLLVLFLANLAFSQTVWNGNTNTTWHSQTQTTFTITTAEQLAGLRQLVNAGNDFYGKTIKLGANIALNSTTNWQNWDYNTTGLNSWTPIGTNANKFNGTFDGAGFTIQGIFIFNISTGTSGFQGLFGSIGNHGKVQNIGVISSYIRGWNSVGGIAGSNHGIIINCHSSATITGNDNVGDIVGLNAGIIETSYSNGTVKGQSNVGGFVGFNVGVIDNSYSNSSVDGEYDFVGGFTGKNSGMITNSYSIGTVTCTGGRTIATDCGGFVGGNYSGKIYTSYSTGKINKNGDLTQWRYNIGGFIGKHEKSLLNSLLEKLTEYAINTACITVVGIECSSIAGRISSALVGGDPIIEISYCDSLTSGQKNLIGAGTASKGGVTFKTTSAMKTKSTFSKWDFINSWDISNTVNSGYPHLLNPYNSSLSGGSSSSSSGGSSSSGSGGSSSSSSGKPSYHIFAYNGKDAINMPTTYGGYTAAYVYNGATINNQNDVYSDGILGFAEGVAKLWNVALAAPDEYSGAGIVIDNKTYGIPNISDCEKISYYYKGDPHWFQVEFSKDICENPALADDNKWGLEITPAQNTWVKRTVDLTTLKLARSWDGAGCGGEYGYTGAVPVDLTKATKMSWVFDDNVNNGASKNLMIANVACLTPSGGAIADNAPPDDITVASGWPTPSYHIFAYKGKDAEFDTTAYGNYIGAYVYNGATVSNSNYNDGDEILGYSEGVAKLWNVTLAALDEYSGAGLVIDNRISEKPNVADCEEISYYYKGDPHWFLVEFQADLCDDPELAYDNKWGLEVTPAQSVWTKKTVDLNTLKIARSWEGAGCGGEYGNIEAVPVDLSKATKISWVFDDNVNNGASKNLMIANVACLTPNGGLFVDSAPPEDITVANGWTSPSSSSGEIQPSSSSGTETPIHIPQIASGPISVQPVSSGILLENLPSNAKVELYNLQGKQVYLGNSGNSQILKILIQTKGVYIVKVGAKTFKVVK